MTSHSPTALFTHSALSCTTLNVHLKSHSPTAFFTYSELSCTKLKVHLKSTLTALEPFLLTLHNLLLHLKYVWSLYNKMFKNQLQYPSPKYWKNSFSRLDFLFQLHWVCYSATAFLFPFRVIFLLQLHGVCYSATVFCFLSE